VLAITFTLGVAVAPVNPTGPVTTDVVGDLRPDPDIEVELPPRAAREHRREFDLTVPLQMPVRMGSPAVSGR